MKIEQEDGGLMFLAECVDFEELIFPLFKGMLDDLMIFGLVSVNSIEFVDIIEIHIDKVRKPVTIEL
jgi:hypothetical protein